MPLASCKVRENFSARFSVWETVFRPHFTAAATSLLLNIVVIDCFIEKQKIIVMSTGYGFLLLRLKSLVLRRKIGIGSIELIYCERKRELRCNWLQELQRTSSEREL